jgi:hypothetical protein
MRLSSSQRQGYFLTELASSLLTLSADSDVEPNQKREDIVISVWL